VAMTGVEAAASGQRRGNGCGGRVLHVDSRVKR
jgi:hypothetical protein